MLTLICGFMFFCDKDPLTLGERTYAVTFSAAGAGGTIAAFVDGAPIQSGAAVEHGKNVVFSASPNSGYLVKHWTRNGEIVVGNSTNTFTVNNLLAAAVVTVVFEIDQNYAVTFSAADAGGTIAAFVDGAPITSGATAAHGRSVIFTAAPVSGYVVNEWTLNGGVVEVENPTVFIISELTAAAVVNVSFRECAGEECSAVINTYMLMFTAGAGGTIAASVDGAPIQSNTTVDQGKTVAFTASPDNDYIVREWMLNDVIVSGNNTNTLTVENISAMTRVTVSFRSTNIDNLGMENAIVITYGNSVDVHNPLAASVNAIVNGGHVELRAVAPVAGGIDVVMSGTASNGSFKAYASDIAASAGMAVRLHLNGVNITNLRGPAISFPRGRNIDTVYVNLVAGKENRLSDGTEDYDPTPEEEQAKGPFFSESGVVFDGGGSLEVRSKSTRPAAAAGGDYRGRHAIVVDHHITIRNGNITIPESTNDGIHANREINIMGGTLNIKSVGDAIQNERNYPITISGGRLILETSGIKSHGIACDSNNVIISGGADINIKVRGNGAKGIRSRGNVDFRGGVTVIDTYGGIDSTGFKPGEDDDDGTSSASGVRVHRNFIMSGGELTAKNRGENSKGINSNGNVTITNGTIYIMSIGHGVKLDGEFRILAGKLTSLSYDKKAIDHNPGMLHPWNENATVDRRDRCDGSAHALCAPFNDQSFWSF